jgi:hypothetical protein
VRILSLAAIACVGCYAPAVDDCQFTCPDGTCPGDLTCTAGYCRAPGASETSSCGPRISPCPAAPPGCSPVASDIVVCLVACSNALMWGGAQNACAATPPWHLAVLDTPSKLTAAEDALKTSISWIGLTRTGTVGDWIWPDGTSTVSPTSSEWTTDPLHSGTALATHCAGLSNGELYSDDCQASHRYACTAD